MVFVPCPNSDPLVSELINASPSPEEFWSFFLDVLDEPLDFFVRECFGIKRPSHAGNPLPRPEFCCLLVLLLLAGDPVPSDLVGESIKALADWSRLDCFISALGLRGENKGESPHLRALSVLLRAPSLLFLAGEFIGEAAALDERLDLCFGFSVRIVSMIRKQASANEVNSIKLICNTFLKR